MNQHQMLAAFNREKYLKLIAVIFIDLLGVLSYLVPAVGELGDLVIAPVSAVLLYAVFKSTKISAFGFAEELLPFTDVIPTGTIFWIKRYVIKEKETLEQYIKSRADQQSVLDKLIPR